MFPRFAGGQATAKAEPIDLEAANGEEPGERHSLPPRATTHVAHFLQSVADIIMSTASVGREATISSVHVGVGAQQQPASPPQEAVAEAATTPAALPAAAHAQPVLQAAPNQPPLQQGIDSEPPAGQASAN